MTMKAFTPQEARQEVTRQELKCVWLEDQRGGQIVAKNPPNTDVNSHLDRIFRTLESPVLPDAIYHLKGKESTRSKSQPLSIPIVKGQGMGEQQTYLVNGQPFAPGSPEMYQPGNMTFQQILQLYADNARLQAENNVMRQSLASCEARCEMLEELLEDLREENREMSEGMAGAGGDVDMNQIALAAMPGLMEMLKPTNKAQPGVPGQEDPVMAQLGQAIQQLAQGQQQQQQLLNQLVADLYKDEPDTGQDPHAAPAAPGQPGVMSEDEILASLQAQDLSGTLVTQYLNAKQLNHVGE